MGSLSEMVMKMDYKFENCIHPQQMMLGQLGQEKKLLAWHRRHQNRSKVTPQSRD